jgi:hypothetical protein
MPKIFGVGLNYHRVETELRRHVINTGLRPAKPPYGLRRWFLSPFEATMASF